MNIKIIMNFLVLLKNEEGSSIYYQDIKGRWYKDNFDKNGQFLNTEKYNIDLVLNDEDEYLKDLNNDREVGLIFYQVRVKIIFLNQRQVPMFLIIMAIINFF